MVNPRQIGAANVVIVLATPDALQEVTLVVIQDKFITIRSGVDYVRNPKIGYGREQPNMPARKQDRYEWTENRCRCSPVVDSPERFHARPNAAGMVPGAVVGVI
jgi:hypothetical protein